MTGEKTVVLVGRTGNGKSSTGNAILGKNAFKSVTRAYGTTTRTCELQQTKLPDGQVINVIDTPGLFDHSAGSEFASKEIVKCINMAKEGIHAFLLVLSARNRFTEEEEAAFRTLQNLFGNSVTDYMILVFTGGDELEYNDETLDDVLSYQSPKTLKEMLKVCKDRKVLFDNKTMDENKRAAQVEELLSLVDRVTEENGGKPYTNELFKKVQRGVMKSEEQEEVVDSFKPRILEEYEENLHKISTREIGSEAYTRNRSRGAAYRIKVILGCAPM